MDLPAAPAATTAAACPAAAAAAAAAATEPKRRHTITFAQRRALRRQHALDPAQKQRALALWFEQTFGKSITQSSISDSLSDKYAFLDAAPASPHDLGRARLARSDHPDLEARLYEWQQMQQAQRLSVTGPLLKAAAERIWASLPHTPDDKDFKFSNGWLEGYKKRHGLLRRRDRDVYEHADTLTPAARAAKRPKMTSRLQHRVAIVTGSSSGLGRAIALRYAAEGARVVCADLQPDLLNAAPGEAGATHEVLQRLHGPECAIFVPCDVASEPLVKGLVDAAVQWAGRLDIMVNNAGIAAESSHSNGRSLRLHDLPMEVFDRAMAVNVRGVALGCKYALTQMLEQDPLPPNDRGDCTRGWIVNTASMLGTVAFRGLPGYVASKHAVVGLTKQLAIDYAKDRIHCNALCPGFVDTPMLTGPTSKEGVHEALRAAHPWDALGTAHDVAKAAVFLASDDASWITGHALLVDGGYTAQ